MNRLIEKIKSIINVAEKEGENMDDVSWGMQEGILLSYNEAKSIVSFYESIPTPAMVDDGRKVLVHKCKYCGEMVSTKDDEGCIFKPNPPKQ